MPDPMAAMTAEQRSTLNKSITRLLQHSILQLCNEHIGYTHKLQILGVLCMTVDDEQQELVVKVNNTLKRVNPTAPTQKEMPPLAPLQPVAIAGVSHKDDGKDDGTALSSSPSPGNGNGRKGRKGTNPIKIDQVYDEAQPVSDEDEDEPITVIPEAPEASMEFDGSQGSPAAGSTPSSPASTPGPRQLNAGSAKRKPIAIRVPNYKPSPSSSPYTIRPLVVDEAASNRMITVSKAVSGTPVSSGGVSLPIYVGGTYSNPDDSDDITDVATGLVNGTNADDDEDLHNGSDASPGSVRIKSEPLDESGGAMDLTMGEGDTPRTAGGVPCDLFQAVSTNSLIGPDGTPQTLPYNITGFNLLRPSDLSFTAPDIDGLTIKYTPTGPYTVSANGKDVSNSSRIKDIILYDDQSPLAHQKGSLIKAGGHVEAEQDYIVDKLGMDGRKRRRRAPEDQLTQEEISEYLGHDREDYSVKCKYCPEEFDSVTRYLHHSLAAHQSYICHQCGKSFTTKSSLLRHRPIHTGQRRFACSICRKTFYRKDKCKAHIKRHLGTGEVVEPVNVSEVAVE